MANEPSALVASLEVSVAESRGEERNLVDRSMTRRRADARIDGIGITPAALCPLSYTVLCPINCTLSQVTGSQPRRSPAKLK